MEVKNSAGYFFNLSEYINSLKFNDKAPGFFMRLMSINEELTKTLVPFQKKRQELISEFGEKTEEGNIQVPQEKVADFMKEIKKYEQEELTVEIKNPLRISDLKGINISELTPLKAFIETVE